MKTYTNNTTKKTYNVAIDSKTDDIVILASGNETLAFTHEALENAVKSGEFTATEEKIALAKKCNKQSTEQKLHDFASVLLDSVKDENDYIIKREDAKANKFLLVYVNPSTKKFRNIAELFCKVRANIMSIFIREENIAENIDYNKELALMHKAHNYNFWIETSTALSKEEMQKAVLTMINNHKKTIKA